MILDNLNLQSHKTFILRPNCVSMVSSLEVVTQINIVAAILIYIPLILNFKYWYQTKIRDYLFISLFFLTRILSNFATASDIWHNQTTFRLNILFNFLGLFLWVGIAVRAKWEFPPNWARIIHYSILFSFSVYLLIPGDVFYRGWWIGQAFYNPIEAGYIIFVIYCFTTTRVELIDNNKAKSARFFWIIFGVIGVYQNFIFWTLTVLAGVPLEEVNVAMWLLIGINALASESTLLLMHIFFPQAVLITHAQLLRAMKVYNNITKYEKVVLNVGIDNIVNYLDEARQKLSDLSVGE